MNYALFYSRLRIGCNRRLPQVGTLIPQVIEIEKAKVCKFVYPCLLIEGLLNTSVIRVFKASSFHVILTL